jgi:septal ring-binding cell division protein DamX
VRTLLFALLLSFVVLSQAAPDLEAGYKAYEAGNPAQAATIWRALAEAGDETAQLNLGQLYRLGQGVPTDDSQAIKWYTLASRQGSETAKYNLLKMREEGRASHADLSAAFSTSTSQKVQDNWLSQLSGDDQLVQILDSSSRAALESYRGKHLGGVQPQPQVVYSPTDQGVDWYVLLWGPFVTYERAKSMLSGLPAEVLKSKPRVRSVESVQALVAHAGVEG